MCHTRELPFWTKFLTFLSFVLIGLFVFFVVKAVSINCEECDSGCNICQCNPTNSTSTIIPDNFKCKFCCNDCPCNESERAGYITGAVFVLIGAIVTVVATYHTGSSWCEKRNKIEEIKNNESKSKKKSKEQENKIKEQEKKIKQLEIKITQLESDDEKKQEQEGVPIYMNAIEYNSTDY